MKNHTLILAVLFFLFLAGTSQVVSDFETDIEYWYSEGDGDYLWELGTGNPGNNFRVNDDATGDINLSYAPGKFLGNWSNATTADYISADIFLNQISGSYISNNFVFQIEGPGGKAKALSGTTPPFYVWTTYSVTIDPANWTVLEGTWNGLIQQVNELIVRMEYINGDEWNRLDNVELSFTPLVIPVSPVICSGFEEGGYDGWSFSGNGSVSNQTSGGNPGHYIRINNGSGTALASAPPKFLGDWSLLDNHAAEIHVDMQFTAYTGNPYVHDFFIKIAGPGGEAKFPVSPDVSYAYNDWHTFTVAIDETYWTMVSGTWAGLISNVFNLQLILEFFDGSETVFMDNFCVTNLPPLAEFNATPTILFPGNQSTFNDISINGPDSWTWDFGDAQTGDDKNPEHTYLNPGLYDVELTVSNHFGADNLTKTSYIEVLDDTGCPKFEDDFDDASIHPVWQFVDGTWSESSGLFRQTSNFYSSGYLNGAYALTGSPLWQDYAISCDFLSTDNDGIGFVFNYQDNLNMYMFHWNAQTNERLLLRWDNGVQTILASDAVPYSTNVWYHAEIAAISGKISVRIDGLEIFSANDATYTGGMTGPYCWANQQSHYNNFMVSCTGFEVDITAMLEGPFNAGEMNTGLNTGGFISPAQPFDASPWFYNGLENVLAMPNANVTDWVLIELRDAPDAASALPSTVVGQKAAFILSDGSVVDLDGISPLRFNIDIQNQLFAIIRHRNHIPVMTSGPLPLSAGVYAYDFTSGSGQAYGTDAQKDLGGGVFGLYAGDYNADKTINSSDKTIIWNVQAGTGGYLHGDGNMDGQVNNPDKNASLLPNYSTISQIPE